MHCEKTRILSSIGVPSNRIWAWKREYDERGNLIAFRTPEAISAYDVATSSTPGAATPATCGLVARYAYESGQNRLKAMGVSDGDDDPVWTERIGLPNERPHVSATSDSSVSRFSGRRSDVLPDAADRETVSFCYGLTGDAVRWIETTVEAEGATENGPVSVTTYSSFEVLDARGRARWSGLADGTLIERFV